jgi:hypothetical protein
MQSADAAAPSWSMRWPHGGLRRVAVAYNPVTAPFRRPDAAYEKAARALGVVISPVLLAIANEVIE